MGPWLCLWVWKGVPRFQTAHVSYMLLSVLVVVDILLLDLEGEIARRVFGGEAPRG
jgi:hypothetical protein